MGEVHEFNGPGSARLRRLAAFTCCWPGRRPPSFVSRFRPCRCLEPLLDEGKVISWPGQSGRELCSNQLRRRLSTAGIASTTTRELVTSTPCEVSHWVPSNLSGSGCNTNARSTGLPVHSCTRAATSRVAEAANHPAYRPALTALHRVNLYPAGAAAHPLTGSRRPHLEPPAEAKPLNAKHSPRHLTLA